MKTTMSVLLLALAATSASAAEDIYRSVMPDGSIRYGESAAPGAKSVKKVPTGPTTSGVTIVTPAEQQRGAGLVPQGGAVGVIPQPVRPPAPPAEQGLTQTTPNTLPKSGY